MATSKKDMKPQLETILLSTEDRPLEEWSKTVKNGYIKRVSDEEITDKVLELMGLSENVTISTPNMLGKGLGIVKRWFCLVFKPLSEKPFKFEVQCLDSSGIQRTFRFDTKFNAPKVRYLFTDIPFGYKPGWNYLEVDLRSLMRRCYCTDMSEITRVQVHAACRLRRVYFTDVYCSDDSLPDDYKLISTSTKQPAPVAAKPIIESNNTVKSKA